MVEAATFVRLSGDACIIHMRDNYWNLTWDSMEISNLYFSYITFYVLLIITQIFHDISINE